jgi:hypothetical protein
MGSCMERDRVFGLKAVGSSPWLAHMPRLVSRSSDRDIRNIRSDMYDRGTGNVVAYYGRTRPYTKLDKIACIVPRSPLNDSSEYLSLNNWSYQGKR